MKTEESLIVDYLTATRVETCSIEKCLYNLQCQCNRKLIHIVEKGSCRSMKVKDSDD